MNGTVWTDDLRGLLISKRTSYSLLIISALALIVAVVVRFSPEGLKSALEAAAPGSAGVFEYLWIEDVLDKLFILIFVSFGAFAVCDLEEEGMTELMLTKPESRLGIVTRRLAVSMASMILIFVGGSAIASAIGTVVVGEMDAGLFLFHQILVLPMCVFVFSLTFFLSVPLRTTASTVVTSFGISLALSFTYSFILMTGDPIPSPLNPLDLGYRMLLNMPLEESAIIAFVASGAMLAAGIIWYKKKDF